MTKLLLSGNEAIARGAWSAGVRVATAYPGTPSTEILENAAKYDEIAAQWSPNEKVALEVAIGASMAGARSICAMKHVGVNVAADPLLTLAYTGVNGGLVLISADDPGIHSSQNEQDNRFYGRFARIPVLEPSDSQEAHDYAAAGLAASEALDTAILLRTTTRISHSKSLVQTRDRRDVPLRPYTKDVRKWVMIPGHARLRQPEVLARYDRMLAWAEVTDLNRIEWGDKRLGVVTSGIAYQYVREARPDLSVLKLGVTYPFPAALVRRFAAEVEQVIVIEELETFLLEALLIAGLSPVPHGLPRAGELSATLVGDALARALGEERPARTVSAPAPAPPRPPVLCPGCPHRGVFSALHKLGLTVTGDIGCYTLGVLAPLSAMDVFMCMGASIGMALGVQKANPEMAARTVAVIGDSTFLHSGMTGLLDMVYNGGTGTVLILDNGTTAMTGHQDHPGTGKTLQGTETVRADLEAICRGLGVQRVHVADPFDPDALEALIAQEVAAPAVSVIIVRHPCVLIEKPKREAVEFEEIRCSACQMCMDLGCPAMSWVDGKPSINEALCAGCGLCAAQCPSDALHVREASHA